MKDIFDIFHYPTVALIVYTWQHKNQPPCGLTKNKRFNNTCNCETDPIKGWWYDETRGSSQHKKLLSSIGIPIIKISDRLVFIMANPHMERPSLYWGVVRALYLQSDNAFCQPNSWRHEAVILVVNCVALKFKMWVSRDVCQISVIGHPKPIHCGFEFSRDLVVKNNIQGHTCF